MKYLKEVLKRLLCIITVIVLVPPLIAAQLFSIILCILVLPIVWIFIGINLLDTCGFLWEGEIVILPMQYIIEKIGEL